MKIALVDPSLFTWPYDEALVRGLRAGRHDVTLYGTVPARGEAAAKPDFLKVHFYRRLSGGLWRTLPKPVLRAAKGVSHVFGMRAFCREMERVRPGVIHFQWLPLPMIDARFIRRLRRVAPVVLTVHDTMPFNGAPGSSLQTVGAFDAFRHFDALIAHTEKGRDLVAARVGGGIPVHQVAHGLLHEAEMAAAPVDPPPRPAEAPTTFLLFGKLKPYKGLDTLIEALARLDPATRARCRLRVVGKAYMDMAPLEKLARDLGVADSIEYDLRFVSTDELNRIFHGADALVFPYRQIEASGVLMTAIAVGKPVIATRMGAAEELFGDGAGGILIGPDDPEALADAMRRFIDSPNATAAFTADVRRLRDAIPSWAVIARRTAAIYDQALADWREAFDPMAARAASRARREAARHASPANRLS